MELKLSEALEKVKKQDQHIQDTYDGVELNVDDNSASIKTDKPLTAISTNTTLTQKDIDVWREAWEKTITDPNFKVFTYPPIEYAKNVELIKDAEELLGVLTDVKNAETTEYAKHLIDEINSFDEKMETLIPSDLPSGDVELIVNSDGEVLDVEDKADVSEKKADKEFFEPYEDIDSALEKLIDKTKQTKKLKNIIENRLASNHWDTDDDNVFLKFYNQYHKKPNDYSSGKIINVDKVMHSDGLIKPEAFPGFKRSGTNLNRELKSPEDFVSFFKDIGAFPIFDDKNLHLSKFKKWNEENFATLRFFCNRYKKTKSNFRKYEVSIIESVVRDIDRLYSDKIYDKHEAVLAELINNNIFLFGQERDLFFKWSETELSDIKKRLEEKRNSDQIVQTIYEFNSKVKYLESLHKNKLENIKKLISEFVRWGVIAKKEEAPQILKSQEWDIKYIDIFNKCILHIEKLTVSDKFIEAQVKINELKDLIKLANENTSLEKLKIRHKELEIFDILKTNSDGLNFESLKNKLSIENQNNLYNFLQEKIKDKSIIWDEKNTKYKLYPVKENVSIYNGVFDKKINYNDNNYYEREINHHIEPNKQSKETFAGYTGSVAPIGATGVLSVAPIGATGVLYDNYEFGAINQPKMHNYYYNHKFEDNIASLAEQIRLEEDKRIFNLLDNPGGLNNSTLQEKWGHTNQYLSSLLGFEKFGIIPNENKKESKLYSEVKKASYRVAANQLNKIAQNIIISSLPLNKLQTARQIMTSDFGTAIVSMAGGMALTYGSKNNQVAQNLATELRIKAFETAGNSIISEIIDMMQNVIFSNLKEENKNITDNDTNNEELSIQHQMEELSNQQTTTI